MCGVGVNSPNLSFEVKVSANKSRRYSLFQENGLRDWFQVEIWNISLKKLEIKRVMKREVYQI